MGGGLIQLTTYTAQDVFLTGNPQITFFKSVYRRHTNFSIETVELPFEGSYIAFGETLNCPIDKLGDLMWRTSLVVNLPQVQLPRPTTTPNPYIDILRQRMQIAYTSYTTIHSYMGLTMAVYRASVALIQSGNLGSLTNVQQTINLTLNTLDPLPSTPIQTAFAQLINNDCPTPQNANYPSNDLVNKLSLKFVASNTVLSNLKVQFEYVRLQLQLLESRYWDSYVAAQKAYQANSGAVTSTSPQYAKFAWIRKLGHFIIEWIDISIGGNRIDRQWGEWINIWHELTKSSDQQVGYDELIGNTPELTTFDTIAKPEKTIVVPIPFWYCRDNGLSLPLVALNYYDIRLTVKFRKMEELCYTDIPGALDPDIIRITDAKMWIDYIYLDATERRRFAQSSHEYLIQQVQVEEYTDLSLSKYSIDLHFSNPVKELVWVYQRTDLVTNTDDTQEPQWDNYTLDRRPSRAPPVTPQPIAKSISTVDLGYGLVINRDVISVAASYPNFAINTITSVVAERRAINTTQLVLNQQNRTEVNDCLFFENLQTYAHHRSGGAPGINVLSFADRPEITQPTGSCNMGRLDKANLNVVFNYDYLYNFGFPIAGKIRVYALSYNVLRFMSGVCGLAFVSGV